MAFLLYFIVILLSLFAVSVSILVCVLYLILLSIALYATYTVYLQKAELLLSESGLVERVEEGKCYSGKIGQHSFYNGFFIFLQLDIKNSVFTEKTTKQFLTIYKDAISEEEYTRR